MSVDSLDDDESPRLGLARRLAQVTLAEVRLHDGPANGSEPLDRLETHLRDQLRGQHEPVLRCEKRINNNNNDNNDDKNFVSGP